MVGVCNTRSSADALTILFVRLFVWRTPLMLQTVEYLKSQSRRSHGESSWDLWGWLCPSLCRVSLFHGGCWWSSMMEIVSLHFTYEYPFHRELTTWTPNTRLINVDFPTPLFPQTRILMADTCSISGTPSVFQNPKVEASIEPPSMRAFHLSMFSRIGHSLIVNLGAKTSSRIW